MWRCGRLLYHARHYSQQTPAAPAAPAALAAETVKMVDGRLALSPEQTLGVQQMQRNGAQVAQIAQALGVKQKYVKTMLRTKKEFGGHELHNDPWSKEEEKTLLRLLKNQRVENVQYVAKKLGRFKWSVTRKIAELVEQAKSPRTFEDSDLEGEVSERERAVLDDRLTRILSGLMETEKTKEWDRVLKEKSTAEWAAEILAGIPTKLQHMLASDKPPTAADLRCLEWEDSRDFGVYICVMEQRSPNPKRPEEFIYVGSATQYNSGLAGRKAADRQKFRPTAIEERAFEYGLERNTSHHATLFSMEVVSTDVDDVLQAKYVTGLAKAVLMIWLRALSNNGVGPQLMERRRFLGFGCWGPGDITYRGTCFQNPLSRDIQLTSPDEEGSDISEIRKENQGFSVAGRKGGAPEFNH